MDAVMIAAVGTIVTGLTAGAAALIGHRTSARVTRDGQVLGGYSTLVDDLQEERKGLQEERAALQVQLAEAERLLAAAYAELANERASRAEDQVRIVTLTAEIERLRAQIAELGGQPL